MLSTQSLRKVVDRRAESLVRSFLDDAGVSVGGDAPHDLEVHDERFYTRVLLDGSLGLGEAYMDGWWDSRAVDETCAALLRARLDRKFRSNLSTALLAARARIANLQSMTRSGEVGRRHYDIGNDFYGAMLGERMVYTCAYFDGTDDLDAAQEAKLDLVCRKAGLRPGARVLELGCGWGSFARFAAEK
jgi:cyclopropane-fatty-acyl-phospholipid synthase